MLEIILAAGGSAAVSAFVATLVHRRSSQEARARHAEELRIARDDLRYWQRRAESLRADPASISAASTAAGSPADRTPLTAADGGRVVSELMGFAPLDGATVVDTSGLQWASSGESSARRLSAFVAAAASELETVGAREVGLDLGATGQARFRRIAEGQWLLAYAYYRPVSGLVFDTVLSRFGRTPMAPPAGAPNQSAWEATSGFGRAGALMRENFAQSRLYALAARGSEGDVSGVVTSASPLAADDLDARMALYERLVTLAHHFAETTVARVEVVASDHVVSYVPGAPAVLSVGLESLDELSVRRVQGWMRRRDLAAGPTAGESAMNAPA